MLLGNDMKKMFFLTLTILIVSLIILSYIILKDKESQDIRFMDDDDIDIIISMERNNYKVSIIKEKYEEDKYSREYSYNNVDLIVNITIKNVSNNTIYIPGGWKEGTGLWVTLMTPSNQMFNRSINPINAEKVNMKLKSNEEIHLEINLSEYTFYPDVNSKEPYLFNISGKHVVHIHTNDQTIISNQVEFYMIE